MDTKRTDDKKMQVERKAELGVYKGLGAQICFAIARTPKEQVITEEEYALFETICRSGNLSASTLAKCDDYQYSQNTQYSRKTLLDTLVLFLESSLPKIGESHLSAAAAASPSGVDYENILQQAKIMLRYFQHAPVSGASPIYDDTKENNNIKEGQLRGFEGHNVDIAAALKRSKSVFYHGSVSERKIVTETVKQLHETHAERRNQVVESDCKKLLEIADKKKVESKAGESDEEEKAESLSCLHHLLTQAKIFSREADLAKDFVNQQQDDACVAGWEGMKANWTKISTRPEGVPIDTQPAVPLIQQDGGASSSASDESSDEEKPRLTAKVRGTPHVSTMSAVVLVHSIDEVKADSLLVETVNAVYIRVRTDSVNKLYLITKDHRSPVEVITNSDLLAVFDRKVGPEEATKVLSTSQLTDVKLITKQKLSPKVILNEQQAQDVVGQGFNLNEIDDHGFTVVAHAAMNNRPRLVRIVHRALEIQQRTTTKEKTESGAPAVLKVDTDKKITDEKKTERAPDNDPRMADTASPPLSIAVSGDGGGGIASRAVVPKSDVGQNRGRNTHLKNVFDVEVVSNVSYMMLAVWHGSGAAAAELLECGASVTEKLTQPECVDERGRGFGYLVAREGSADAIKKLVKYAKKVDKDVTPQSHSRTHSPKPGDVEKRTTPPSEASPNPREGVERGGRFAPALLAERKLPGTAASDHSSLPPSARASSLPSPHATEVSSAVAAVPVARRRSPPRSGGKTSARKASLSPVSSESSEASGSDVSETHMLRMVGRIESLLYTTVGAEENTFAVEMLMQRLLNVTEKAEKMMWLYNDRTRFIDEEIAFVQKKIRSAWFERDRANLSNKLTALIQAKIELSKGEVSGKKVYSNLCDTLQQPGFNARRWWSCSSKTLKRIQDKHLLFSRADQVQHQEQKQQEVIDLMVAGEPHQKVRSQNEINRLVKNMTSGNLELLKVDMAKALGKNRSPVARWNAMQAFMEKDSRNRHPLYNAALLCVHGEDMLAVIDHRMELVAKLLYPIKDYLLQEGLHKEQVRGKFGEIFALEKRVMERARSKANPGSDKDSQSDKCKDGQDTLAFALEELKKLQNDEASFVNEKRNSWHFWKTPWTRQLVDQAVEGCTNGSISFTFQSEDKKGDDHVPTLQGVRRH